MAPAQGGAGGAHSARKHGKVLQGARVSITDWLAEVCVATGKDFEWALEKTFFELRSLSAAAGRLKARDTLAQLDAFQVAASAVQAGPNTRAANAYTKRVRELQKIGFPEK